MNATQVRSLPLREKFEILEVIWEDLSNSVDNMPVSDSDKRLLDSRIERIRTGEAKVHNWEDVKHSIGRK